MDDFLSVLISHKHSEFNLVLNVCYLPPEDSIWGRDATGYFAHVLSVIYTLNKPNLIICIQDVNAKLGGNKDYIECIYIILPGQA